MKTERLEREALIRWMVDAPTYRVDFWRVAAPADPARGVAAGYERESHLVYEADVTEVISWAGEVADGRSVTIYATASAAGEPGLIRLCGRDPSSVD